MNQKILLKVARSTYDMQILLSFVCFPLTLEDEIGKMLKQVKISWHHKGMLISWDSILEQ